MCGICGKLNYDGDPVDPRLINDMMSVISHRGPDGNGAHLNGPAGLGHVRLSIIDLSTCGAQPMCNEDGTVWIAFNGEIYNYLELRQDLIKRGHQFRSGTDTEVIIHLYEDHGPECVEKLRGMFAFAIWDSKQRKMLIARDRVGIKPVYYYEANGTLIFGSELKCILADPGVKREINYNAVRSFLSFNYVPGEQTLIRGIRKLLPGHLLISQNGRTIDKCYWDLKFTEERYSQPYEECVEELYSLIKSTVKDHMMADVPVGVLLSGGVDSSAVLSFAVQGTEKKVSSFTVGFDGGDVVDERPYARLAAERFGTDHHELTISAEDFWNFLPSYVWHMEEPVCEPPAVALYYVSRLARNHVKVLLSGEGGDEAFAGYPNYPNMMRLSRWGETLGPLSRIIGSAAGFVGALRNDQRVKRYSYALGRPLEKHYFSRTASPVSFFNRQAEQFFTPEFLHKTSEHSPENHMGSLVSEVGSQPLLNQMLYIDSKTWLPDDLLVKADKMTMANSVELRVPLLDHKVLEFAASLPCDFKVQGRNTKRVLKSAFEKTVPEEVIKRKKAGFPVPYEKWLSNGLKERVTANLLADDSLVSRCIDHRSISYLLNGQVRAKEVFSLLVLNLWHSQFLHAEK